MVSILYRGRDTLPDLRELVGQAPEHQPGIGNDHEQFLIGYQVDDDGAVGMFEHDLPGSAHAGRGAGTGKKPYCIGRKCGKRIDVERIVEDIFDDKTVVPYQCGSGYALDLQELAQDLLQHG